MYTEDRNLHYFREISRIPRKSFHEKAVVDYIQRFAEERGLRFQRDTLHNLILWAPATPGREGEAPLMLQAHTDMVCAKEPWSTHDFLKDPIELVEENGWLHANGTTLGADDSPEGLKFVPAASGPTGKAKLLAACEVGGTVAAYELTPKAAPAVENPFTDITADDYYYDAVLWAVKHQITKGTGEDTFSPDASCTRGQVVTFLHRDFQGE